MGMSVDAAQITVDQMLDIADRELRRLQLAQGTIYWHCRELRDFADYCVQNAAGYGDHILFSALWYGYDGPLHQA